MEEGWWSQRSQLTWASPRTQQLNWYIVATGKILSELYKIYLKQYKTLLPEVTCPTEEAAGEHLTHFPPGVWSSGSLKQPWALFAGWAVSGTEWEAAKALLSPYSVPHSIFWCFNADFLSCHHLFSPRVIYFHSGFSFFALPALYGLSCSGNRDHKQAERKG